MMSEQEYISSDTLLPAEGFGNGSIAKWTSSHPHILSAQGKVVSFPAETMVVTLTATVENPKDGYGLSYPFDVKVLSKTESGGQIFTDVQAGRSYLFCLSVSQIASPENTIFTLQYNTKDLKLVDAVAQLPQVYAKPGISEDGRIEIISVNPGEIQLRYLGTIPEGKVLNGTVDVLKFSALRNATTKMTATKRAREEKTNEKAE